MRGRTPSDRRLGPLSRDVLAALIDATEAREGISQDRAIAVIEAANAETAEGFWGTDDPEFLATEIEAILNGLLDRGYLYAVDGELYVTERDVLE